MTKILIVVGIIVVVVGGIFLFSQGGENSSGQRSAGEGPLALSFKDYEGNTVALADFAGKPLVINAWAVWCPFCVKELPDFAKVQKEFGDEVIIIAIDRVESRNTVKSFTDNLGITNDLLFLLDPKDSFYKSINGFSMPETIFVDRQGVIQDHKRGPMDADEIRARIQKIL